MWGVPWKCSRLKSRFTGKSSSVPAVFSLEGYLLTFTYTDEEQSPKRSLKSSSVSELVDDILLCHPRLSPCPPWVSSDCILSLPTLFPWYLLPVLSWPCFAFPLLSFHLKLKLIVSPPLPSPLLPSPLPVWPGLVSITGRSNNLVLVVVSFIPTV